jgi:hypothetical protein
LCIVLEIVRDAKTPPEALLDVLHLLREIGREGAWMLGFRDRGRWRVHVWVHKKSGLEQMSAPHNRLCHEIGLGCWLTGAAHHVSPLTVGATSGGRQSAKRG